MKSIAPSIYGHEFIKTGLAMALFGGMVCGHDPLLREHALLLREHGPLNWLLQPAIAIATCALLPAHLHVLPVRCTWVTNLPLPFCVPPPPAGEAPLPRVPPAW